MTKQTFFRLAVSIAIPLLVGFVSSSFTVAPIDTWYQTLEKPFFTPPNWVFGPAWTILYVFMGTAFFLVWQKKGKLSWQKEEIFYAIQLVLNFFWSIFFFGLKNPFLGQLEIIFLWIAILITLVLFWKIDKRAGMLFVPYLAWVSFASVLNGAIAVLN
jgi:tryptophan-rich sensory protein